MKKIVIALILLVALSGCEEQTQTVIEAVDEEVRFAGVGGEVTIVTDNETGCKYIREKIGVGKSQAISMTALLKSDGSAECDLM